MRLPRTTLLLCPAVLLCVDLHAQVVRTGYSPIVAVGTGKCIDIAPNSSSHGGPVTQWPCSSKQNQRWTVQPYQQQNGWFRIVQSGSGYCLSAFGALEQHPCWNSSSELWSFKSVGKNVQLVSKRTGGCASVRGNYDGESIVIQPCSSAANSLWTFSSGLVTPAQASILQAAHSGQCLNSTGVAIIQYPCGGAAPEQWTLSPVNGRYRVVSVNSGLCLSSNGVGGAGAILSQLPCNNWNPATEWNLKPAGGSYQLMTPSGGYCADVTGASQTVGTPVIQWPCSGSKNQLWSLSAAQRPSSWSGVIPLPVNAIATANLPGGDLLMWSAEADYNYQGDIRATAGQTLTSVFNPSSGTASKILVTNTGDNMFCPGTANLFNGNILVNGGSSSSRTSIYNPLTGLWTSDALMNIPRGYEGDTVLANGSVLTIGGSWSGGLGGKTAEVWTQGQGWRLLSGVPETPIVGTDPAGIYRSDNHLWLFSAPNGQVFHAGPSAQMNWINTSGNGTITTAGTRSADPYAVNGNAVLFDVGLILKTGGAPAYSNGIAEAGTYLIDINNGTAGVSVNPIAPMAYPRAFANAVVLPSGEVVVIGGQTLAVPFSDATAVLVPEVWDPLTQVFQRLKPMQTSRVYHSTGILMQDGRVFSGGGGQCGRACTANHLDAEILTPPYLLNADGSAANRPVIATASTHASLGGTITASTNSPVASFVLMRLSSVTHTVNNDQRRIPLQVQSTSGNFYTLSVPSNPGIVLPGNYWLFALDAQGVPSVAADLNILP